MKKTPMWAMPATRLMVCFLAFAPMTWANLMLSGTTVNVTWYSAILATGVGGYSSPVPVTVGPGIELLNYQGLFDIDIADSTIDIYFTTGITFAGPFFHQLTFLFEPNIFAANLNLGTAVLPSQTGCCGYAFVSPALGWRPWVGLGFAASGTSIASSYQAGDHIQANLVLTTPPLSPPSAPIPEPYTVPLDAALAAVYISVRCWRRLDVVR